MVSSASTTTEREVVRPLGAFERLLHHASNKTPFLFCLVAHVAPSPDRGAVERAVVAVQRAYPMLTVGISDGSRIGAAGEPVFVRTRERLDVRIAGGDWRNAVAGELTRGFATESGPLARFVLVPSRASSALVLTVAHEAFDGIGALRVLRGVVAALGGQRLADEPFPVPQEESLPTVDDDPAAPQCADPRLGTLLGTEPASAPPTVITAVLPRGPLSRLRRAARAYGLTVNSAVVAAAVTALRADGRAFVRIAVPIDLRRNAGVPDVVANRFLGTKVGFDPEGPHAFWDLARQAAEQVGHARASVAITGALLREHAPTDPDVSAAAIESELSADMMLSNLGVVESSDPGEYRITGLDGPLLRSGVRREQVLGATTLDGDLHLALVTCDPRPGLLDDVVGRLRAAAAGVSAVAGTP